MRISIITHVNENNVLANELYDTSEIKKITNNKCCIIDKNTYLNFNECIKSKLPIIITPNEMAVPVGYLTTKSKKGALEMAKRYKFDDLYIIGNSITNEFFDIADIIYLKETYMYTKGDKHLPELDLTKWRCVKTKTVAYNLKTNVHGFSYKTYVRL